jgi:aminoglycoside phosphotransferase (APT) family kinase protein
VSEAYVGTLERKDPLYDYLAEEVMPRAEYAVKDPVFHVCRLHGSNIVYKYREERTDFKMIGKFYSAAKPHKGAKLRAEFRNLSKARALGLTRLPNYVVKPLGQEKKMGLGLLEEYVPGKDLDHYVKRAVYEGRHERLRERLSGLAFFLAELHKKTGPAKCLDISPSLDYFSKILDKLRRHDLLDDDMTARLTRLKERWHERDYMYMDQEVLIHGDATPTNFIFPDEDGVVAIDLERMRSGDRMFDVGMVCGELKHAFMWRMGDRYASEQHIGHFLKEYTKHFGDGDRVYWSVARRNPFYMAVTELRIARNNWLDREHRVRLIRESEQCLTWGLKLR